MFELSSHLLINPNRDLISHFGRGRRRFADGAETGLPDWRAEAGGGVQRSSTFTAAGEHTHTHTHRRFTKQHYTFKQNLVSLAVKHSGIKRYQVI